MKDLLDKFKKSLETKEDLTMELYRAQFTNSAIVQLGTYTIVNGINSFCYNFYSKCG